ncbi:RHS repeat-associated core domain-containing protein [Croceimicrobium sp.]|uniref:RHS repeat-associated core domain-containing protein n=1 Tax=Croceimicrobium sp. TaxID=2828340 RepID=UPI003BAC2A65
MRINIDHIDRSGASLTLPERNLGRIEKARRGSTFRFNGKEWDDETGNFYYGARYYVPQISVWLSVDPKSSKYPASSPFVFVANNPLMYVDPNGMEIDWGANFVGALRAYFSSRLTQQGRTKWKELKEDTQALYAFYYSNKMGVAQDQQGNWSVVEGMTYATGQARDGRNRFAIVTFEGTHKAKKHAEEMFQMNNFQDLSWGQKNAGLNDAVASGEVEAVSWNNPNGPNLNVNFNNVNLLFTFDPTSPRPVNNESGAEFRNRIFVHEGTHGLMRSGKWPNTVRRTGGINSEVLPRRYERITIQQQQE